MIDSVNDDETLYQICSILEGHTEPLYNWQNDMSIEMYEVLERSITRLMP